VNEVFRRRRREQAKHAAGETVAAPTREYGPWDADEPHPDHDRIDLGGLRLPHNAAFDVRLASVGDQHVGVVVLWEESSLQLQALAAPKSGGLWEEIKTKIKSSAKTLEERDGVFGTELAGQVTVEGATRPARYIGIDGPRWFLLAVVNGRAAVDDQVAAAFLDFVKDIVVVRGDEPMAREESIPLRRPSDPADEVDDEPINPFRRGPEISETR
jgi:hypothetical protein